MDEKTKKTVLQILLSDRLLTEQQVRDILTKEKLLYNKLLKSKSRTFSRSRIIHP